MKVGRAVQLLALVSLAEAGYYKVRPPAPPPPPPASLHYGPRPPARYHRPSAYPPPPQPHYPHSRYPPSRPGGGKGAHRHYRYPSHPSHSQYSKPVYSPYAWKHGYSAFRAPSVKEVFNTPEAPIYPEKVFPPLLKDDDSGPIHTIPAPNLGPADRPRYHHEELHHGFSSPSQEHSFFEKTPLHSTGEDLAAVLQHGATKVNVPQPLAHTHGYQVTEDPSLHQPHTGPSYFAPDPDPELPTVKLPPTSDPHSVPSNGQVPLDLYLQQEAEKNGHLQHHSASMEHLHHQSLPSMDHHQHHAPSTEHLQTHQHQDNSNQLTAQDLFNLLNYNPSNPTPLLPTLQLQPHLQLQPQIQLYNPVMVPQVPLDVAQNLIPHQSAQFNPHYQNFNYDERTRQGAYGSNSFPVSSIPLPAQSHHDEKPIKENYEDNDIEGSEHHNSYLKVEENEIVQHQPESRKNLAPPKEAPISTKSYSTKNPENIAATIQIHVTPQAVETQTVKPEEQTKTPEPKEETTSTKPEENVQLQKSIQIYQNSYTTTDDLIKQEIKNLNDYEDYTDEEKIVKEMNIGQPIPEEYQTQKTNENVHIVDAVPYGVRVRPKRF